MKYIDLYAGCGGLSVGMLNANWQGLFAIEKSPHAFETLKTNLIDKVNHFDWPSGLAVKNWDIKDLLEQKNKELVKLNGSVDLVVGGPPCQGFSIAGQRNETDERNKLIHPYLKFVELINPRAVLFENVPGFNMKYKSAEQSGVAHSAKLIKQLRTMGYTDVRGQLIDMSDYGIPQRRNRYIIIATTSGHCDAVFDAIKDLSNKHLAKNGIPARNGAKAALSDLLQSHGTAPCLGSKGFMAGIASKPKTGLQKHLRDCPDEHMPDSHRFVNHTDQTKQVFIRLLARAERNRSVQGNERKSYGLKKRSVTVLDQNKPSPTVTTIPDDLIHYSEPRVMTVRECARLQTFPDWFEFKGPYTTGGQARTAQTPRYTQVGNAVPPLFAEIAGLALTEILSAV